MLSSRNFFIDDSHQQWNKENPLIVFSLGDMKSDVSAFFF